MYYFDSKVRYSELNEEGKLRLDGIVNYFQDCSTFQSEHIGMGLDYLKEHKRAWIMSNWNIVIKECASVNDAIRVCTWPREFKGFFGWRNFAIVRDGENIVEADSLWTYLDTEKMHPVKVPDDVMEAYKTEAGLDMEPLSRKMKIPDGYEEREPFVVKRFMLDTNGHMNNGKYVTMAEEYLEQPFTTGQVRVEYKKSALLGDTVVPRVWKDGLTTVVDLCTTEGKSYAIIEFRRDH